MSYLWKNAVRNSGSQCKHLILKFDVHGHGGNIRRGIGTSDSFHGAFLIFRRQHQDEFKGGWSLFSFDQVKDAWTEHGKWKKMKSFNTEFFGFCICIESFGNSSINHIACKETTMPS